MEESKKMVSQIISDPFVFFKCEIHSRPFLAAFCFPGTRHSFSGNGPHSAARQTSWRVTWAVAANVVRCRSWYLRVDPWSLQTAAQVAWVGTQNVLTVRDVCMVSSFFVGVFIKWQKLQKTTRLPKGCNSTVSHATSFVTGCQLETPRKVRTTTPRSHCTEAMGGEGLEMLKKHHVFQPRRYFVTVRGDDISRGSVVNCQQLTITDGEGLTREMRNHKFASRKSLSRLLLVTPITFWCFKNWT